MSLKISFPPVPTYKKLSTLGPLKVVRDPITNYRYLTLAKRGDDDWDDGTQGPEDPIQAVLLTEMEDQGTVVELLPSLEVIIEAAELKILDDNEAGLSTGLTKDEITYLRSNRKIQAIKLIRERTGQGLKEAKEIADKACQDLGLEPKAYPAQY